MTSMLTVNARLAWFVKQQRAKLGTRKNVAKGDWRKMEPQDIYTRIKDELKELKAVLEAAPLDPAAVISECCDVADFAMMLADRMRVTRIDQAIQENADRALKSAVSLPPAPAGAPQEGGKGK